MFRIFLYKELSHSIIFVFIKQKQDLIFMVLRVLGGTVYDTKVNALNGLKV